MIWLAFTVVLFSVSFQLLYRSLNQSHFHLLRNDNVTRCVLLGQCSCEHSSPKCGFHLFESCNNFLFQYIKELSFIKSGCLSSLTFHNVMCLESQHPLQFSFTKIRKVFQLSKKIKRKKLLYISSVISCLVIQGLPYVVQGL